MSGQKEPVQKKEPLSIGDLIAFHLTILLLGGLAVMPIIYSVSAMFGLLGEELSDLISNYSYENLVILSIASLFPSMIAYGDYLKFSLWRFFIGIAIVVYFGLKYYVQLKASVALPLPIGGGMIGVVVATLAGNAGIAIKRVFRSKRLRRLALYTFATLVVTIIALGSLGYFLKWNVWNVETAITLRDKIGVGQFARGVGEVISVQSVGTGNQAALVQLESGQTIVVVSRQDDDGFYCQALTLQPGDRIEFKGSFYTRDGSTKLVSYLGTIYGGLNIHSAAGMVDTLARCGGNPKYAGSIEKL